MRYSALLLALSLLVPNAASAAATCEVERFIGFEIDAGYLAEAHARLGLSTVG